MKRLRLIAFCALATTAIAFPTWMGVVGNVARHDGKNPGTFTILLDRNYTGLHSNVGIQINDGPWKEFAMEFAGLEGGNSKWTHTPKEPFPGGATVKYFFHVWDNWGGNIWDCNGGRNYTLQIPTAASPP